MAPRKTAVGRVHPLIRRSNEREQSERHYRRGMGRPMGRGQIPPDLCMCRGDGGPRVPLVLGTKRRPGAAVAGLILQLAWLGPRRARPAELDRLLQHALGQHNRGEHDDPIWS